MPNSFNTPTEKKYFLLPASPTPNGRMHLGHIAGPYLKMDIFRRKVQRNQGTALLVSGSDVYESYVEAKAQQLNLTEEQVCNKFHDLIIKDFEALDIKFDLFINPLKEEFVDRFALREQELMQMVIDNGNVIEREETFIYDSKNQKYLHGCWIQGICPNCNHPTGSYLCENCGTHYRPMDIFDPKNYPDAELIKSSALYLKLDTEKLIAQIAQVYDGSFVTIFEKYIELQGSYIRLTTLQKTGVSWQWKPEEKQVIFTYLANLFAYIFFADVSKEQLNLTENPLEKDSSFVSVVSFGIDTVIPFTAGLMAVGAELNKYKSFDYYIPNYLYLLNGQKFSTSRNQVIWGSDIVNISHIQSDAVRYYLTKQNPENQEENFDISDFIKTINTVLYEEHNTTIQDAYSKISIHKEQQLTNDLFSYLDKNIVAQNQSINPPVFNFSELIDPIQKWVNTYQQWTEEQKIENCYWWLKGYALISYPILPNISQKIWKNLTSTEEVTLSNFFVDNSLQVDPLRGKQFEKVTYEAIEKCLPEQLKTPVTD